ncbi:MAG: arginine--tRNA ligase [Leptospirales bacterium]
MLERWLREVAESSLSLYIQGLGKGESLKELLPKGIRFEFPKKEGFGDISSPTAMHLAPILKQSPRKIAEAIRSGVLHHENLESVEIAGPGYLNFTFRPEALWQALEQILNPSSSLIVPSETPKKILLEFVSANPTGPLHVGHGRGAAYGDALARVLNSLGHDVKTEYYINDAGNQMEMLGRSTCLAWRRLQRAVSPSEEERFLKGGTPYKGEYIREIAELLLNRDEFLSPQEIVAALDPDGNEKDYLPKFTHLSQSIIMDGIREDLDRFGVTFDAFFSERTLHSETDGPGSDAISTWIRRIRQSSPDRQDESVPDVYESDGAVWLRTTVLGDDKDRVLLRSDGRLTYFAADIAYHAQKIQRGFDMMIDVWGADHHGYIPRMNAAIRTLSKLLGRSSELRIALIQLVNLIRDGRPVSMSTRGGEFVTLKEVLDEVGVDATRFLYLTRSHDSSLDFDLDKAKERSMDNPVYYVQYAHARVMSILRQAEARRIVLPERWTLSELASLTQQEEKELIRFMDRYASVLSEVQNSLEIHPITEYLTDLAGRYHHFYFHHRILSQDPLDSEVMLGRIGLSIAVGRILRSGLEILGVSAPDSM